jgi:hypothetical protein
MVNELILFRHHDETIKGKKSTKGRVFEEINPLELCLFGPKRLDFNGKAHIFGMVFREPQVNHYLPPPQIIVLASPKSLL